MPYINKILVDSVTYDLQASSVYESKILWGNTNFSGSYGCIDAAMVSELGANRFAGLKPAGVFVEYSTNGGSTWTDYGCTNAQKIGMTIGGGNRLGAYLGKHSAAGSGTTSDQLRVRILTSAAGIYTVLNKFVIYMSTSGATVNCTIRARTESNRTGNVDTWVVFANEVPVSGWSGYNVINTSGLTTYGNTAASQYGEIQFIFKSTAVNPNYGNAIISNIFGFGGVGWTTPSTMAKTGHLYSYDSSMNATFPGQVNATNGVKSYGQAVLIGGSNAASAVTVNKTTASLTPVNGTTNAYVALTSTSFTPRTNKTVVTGGTSTSIKPTGGTTNAYVALTSTSMKPITKKTVVVGGTSTSITPVSGSANAYTSLTSVTFTPRINKTVVTGGTSTSITPVNGTTTVLVSLKTTTITPVTGNTVVTGGTSTSFTPVSGTTNAYVALTSTNITPVTAKNVCTSASGATAAVTNSCLFLTDGVFTHGDSVTAGTSTKVITGGTTAAVAKAGTAKNVYTALSTGNAVTSGTAVTVATGAANTTASVAKAGTAVNVYTGLSTGNSTDAGDAINIITGGSTTAVAKAGTAVNVYTGLSTGDSVTEGTAVTVVTGGTTAPVAKEGTAVNVYTALATGDSTGAGTAMTIVTGGTTAAVAKAGTATTVVTDITSATAAAQTFTGKTTNS